jgi:3-oxoacyl-[acyl-carrier protein] reductase
VRFDDRRVLVTGASRGIGRAVANAFAAAGAIVAVHYGRDKAAAEETLRGLPGDGHITVAGDVADPDAVMALVDSTVSQFGGIDILINNAGVYIQHPVLGVSYGDWQRAWRRTLDVNLIGPANLTFCVARMMARGGGGRIVCVSSRGAFRGEPDHPAYAASKAGLNAMTQSLAVALAEHQVFLGVVAPGFVETDMVTPFLDGPEGDAIRHQSPTGRVARPDEVAYAVMFLASPGAEFATGTIIDVNGASYLRS